MIYMNRQQVVKTQFKSKMKSIIAYKLSCLNQDSIPSSRTHILANSKQPTRNLLTNSFSIDFNDAILENRTRATLKPTNRQTQKPDTQLNEEMIAWHFFDKFQEQYQVVKKDIICEDKPVLRDLNPQFRRLQQLGNNSRAGDISQYNRRCQLRTTSLNHRQQMAGPKAKEQRNRDYESCVREQVMSVYPSKENRSFRSISLNPHRVGRSVH